MTSPLVRLILWTTDKVYFTVMKMFPEPLESAEGDYNRYLKADSDFFGIALRADHASYKIAQFLSSHYEHAPKYPLPAELLYLVPLFTWRCLPMICQHVRLLSAKRRTAGDVSPPQYYGPAPAIDEPLPENEQIRLAEEFIRAHAAARIVDDGV